MKKLIYTLVIVAFAATLNAQVVNDEVTMGSNYANDVYYSLENDEVKSVDRLYWDIAFWTNAMNVGIHKNGAAGVELYYMPDLDTNDWATFDTAGFYMLEPRHNTLKMWGDSGAFNIETTGEEFSYGWGKYNIINHKIIGHVLFVIKLQNGALKKIWIVEKNALLNTFMFKYADLDGSNEQTVNLNMKPHTSKNFLYYSLEKNETVDRDPASDSWQLLFTKYVEKVSFGNSMVDYPVTGILTNDEVYVAEVKDVNQANYKDYEAHTFDTAYINVIGSDWKKTIGMPPVFDIDDSLVYFITTQTGDIWKLFFTGFESGTSGSGKFMFSKEKLKGTSSINPVSGNADMLSIYPNPASGNEVNLVYRLSDNERGQLNIFNLNGQVVYTQDLQNQNDLNILNLNTDLNPGIYIVRIESVNTTLTQKLIVK
jgi:hypothetical protein